MTRCVRLAVVLVASGSGLTFAQVPKSAPVAKQAGVAVEVQSHPADRRVDILVGGQPFTSYIWPERLAKPVLYPIRTAKGTPVTRCFPLEPKAGERVDHPHQVGLWFNHGELNGVYFWNNSDARSAQERAKMGAIRHLAIEEAKGGAQGTLTVRLEWVMPDASVALKENTAYRFSGGSDRRSIDRTTTLTALGKRAVFTDNKEGLIGMRVARGLEEPSKRPEILTDANGKPSAAPVASDAGVTGVYTSSEGLKGAAVWGTRARWVALSGRLGDEDVVLLMLDHPKNPNHPTYWHARGYGLFAANPLGNKAFSNGKEELNLAIEPGGSVVFRHRLLVFDGPFSVEKAEAAWKEFAAEKGN